jgi:hypothetical protein
MCNSKLLRKYGSDTFTIIRSHTSHPQVKPGDKNSRHWLLSVPNSRPHSEGDIGREKKNELNKFHCINTVATEFLRESCLAPLGTLCLTSTPGQQRECEGTAHNQTGGGMQMYLLAQVP